MENNQTECVVGYVRADCRRPVEVIIRPPRNKPSFTQAKGDAKTRPDY